MKKTLSFQSSDAPQASDAPARASLEPPRAPFSWLDHVDFATQNVLVELARPVKGPDGRMVNFLRMGKDTGLSVAFDPEAQVYGLFVDGKLLRVFGAASLLMATVEGEAE